MVDEGVIELAYEIEVNDVALGKQRILKRTSMDQPRLGFVQKARGERNRGRKTACVNEISSGYFQLRSPRFIGKSPQLFRRKRYR